MRQALRHLALRGVTAIAWAALCVGVTARSAQAGAWVQDAKQGLMLHSLTYYENSHYYDRHGHTISQSAFRKLEYQPYVEYGLTSSLTLGGSVYLQRDWQHNITNSGLADPELFLRQQLYRDTKNAVSLQPLIKLPSVFSRTHGAPRGGSGSMDGELSLLYGRNLFLLSPRDYADMRIGYRVRSAGLHGQARADAAVGVMLARSVQVVPALHYVRADALGPPQGFREDGEQDYDLLKAEVAMLYHLDTMRWIQASLFSDIAGRQVGSGGGVSVTYAMRF